MMLAERIATLRIDHLGRALAGQAAGDAADDRAGRHADRPAGRADAGPGQGAAGRADTGADDVLTGILGPAALDVRRIRGRTGCHAHQDAAVLDAFLVVLDALFGNTGAD